MSRRLAAVLQAIALLVPGLAQANPLAGTWRAAQGGQSVEITLEAEGRFVRRDHGPDGRAMTVSGHWTLADAGPWLRLTIEDWAPRRACGLVGCTPIRMLPIASISGANVLIGVALSSEKLESPSLMWPARVPPRPSVPSSGTHFPFSQASVHMWPPKLGCCFTST